MYLAQTFKLRYGELPDLFLCFNYPKSGVRCMKERVLYFMYIDGKISGPYRTYGNSNEMGQAFEIYELICNQQILVLEPRQVAQEVLQRKLFLREANYDDLERNTMYFEYGNSKIIGPYYMQTDICEHDMGLITKIQSKKIFIINERQDMPL